MRENRFLVRSTDVGGYTSALIANAPAISSFPSLVAAIEATSGYEAATLFSEPITPQSASGGVSTVSWYASTDSRAIEIDMIDDVARAPIVKKLTRRLEALLPAFHEPETASLLAACLNVPSTHDILAVGGEPILLNWGYLPTSVTTDEQKIAHFVATIGRFAPALVPHVAQTLGAGGTGTRYPAPSGRPSTDPSKEIAPKSAVVADLQTTQRHQRLWLAPLVASLIAATILFIFLLPGVLVYPDGRVNTAYEAFEEERLKRSNDSLEAQLKALEGAAKESVCRAGDAATIPVPGFPSEGDRPGPAPKMELVPRSPENVPLPHSAADPAQPPNVANLLDKATVLVVAFNANSRSQGTGFFISDRLIVTNHHVVVGMNENLVFVASHEHNAVRRAHIVAKSMPPPNQKDVAADFAVLEIEPFDHPAFLKVGTTPPKLSTVYIAGYPGFLTEEDSTFGKMLNGLAATFREDDPAHASSDRSVAVPGADLRYGRINNIMTVGESEFPIIIHDMQLAPGNSGGPLVDACGHASGVNTYVFQNKERGGGQQGNVAQDVSVLRKFLVDHQIAFTADDATCGPSVADNGKVPDPTVSNPPGPSQAPSTSAK